MQDKACLIACWFSNKVKHLWLVLCLYNYVDYFLFFPLLAFEVLVCSLNSFKIQAKQQSLFLQAFFFFFFAAVFLILDSFSSPSPSFSYLAQHPISIRAVASTPLASVPSYQYLSRFYSHHDLTARLLWQEMQIICGLPSTEDPALLQSYFYGVLWCLSRTSPNVLTTDDTVIVLTGE